MSATDSGIGAVPARTARLRQVLSPARPRRLAWSLAALAAALKAAGYVLALAGGSLHIVPTDLFALAIAGAFSIVGALVASRQPRNAIGWIFLGVAVSTGLAGLARGFVEYQLDGDHVGSLVGAAAAYQDVSWIPFVLIPATFLLLLFPDGQLPSPRWRWVARCAAAGIVGSWFADGAGPEPFDDFPAIKNPFAIHSPVMGPLTALFGLLLLVGMVGSAVSLVVRFRRAGRVQRQQIKWLATAGALVVVTFPVMIVLWDAVGSTFANSMIMLTVLGLPAAAGIAILRYRLYDIDVVINRALVYAALSATLAGAYLGTVLLLQLLLSGVTSNSSLAVAVSTLAVAALFQPARGRIQATVDRRFYRRKYDATQTLNRFGARLRDEVDLDALGVELRGVVAETMQPAHVSLWLRAGGR